MTYTYQSLTCTHCGAPFTFTAGEQELYASRGFINRPGRCPDCFRSQGVRRIPRVPRVRIGTDAVGIVGREAIM